MHTHTQTYTNACVHAHLCTSAACGHSLTHTHTRTHTHAPTTDRRLGGEIEVKGRAPTGKEIGVGFVFVSCVRARRSCARAGEAKLRGRARGANPRWLGRERVK
eukprot:9587187-Alexandrium_andersonii.AAC.1